MDITTAFEAVIPGSNPGGSTTSLRVGLSSDRTASVATGFEKVSVIESSKSETICGGSRESSAHDLKTQYKTLNHHIITSCPILSPFPTK